MFATLFGTKLDLRKTLKPLYNPPADEFTLVEVPPIQYLMLDGAGSPDDAAFASSLGALFAVGYALKFAAKKAQGIDYAVMPPEGLWWVGDNPAFTADADRNTWSWTLMIAQPDFITAEQVGTVIEQVKTKKKLPRAGDIRLQTYHEGLCLQKLHRGPYADEPPVLHRLHRAFIPQNGYLENGKHHEIYLNDPNRTAPDKLKTILRQPVRRV
jgi:hypothetical protein